MIDLLLAAAPAVGGFFLGAFYVRVQKLDPLADEHRLLQQRIRTMYRYSLLRRRREAAEVLRWVQEGSNQHADNFLEELSECTPSENP